MTNHIKIEDLPDEVLDKLHLKGEKHGDLPVSERLVVMGKILRQLSGLTNRDALWVLNRVIKDIKGIRDRRGGNHRNNNGDGPDEDDMEYIE